MVGMSNGYIAIDLGAESGRVVVGVLDDLRLRLEEIHRFAHEPVWLPTGLHWDITGIWREIVAGLRKTAAWSRTAGVKLVSVGVDTWGVDWVLIDRAGELVGLPHAYRDPRNGPAYEQVVAKLGQQRIYETTGIQFMALNTLYSLYAHKLADADALDHADRLLFVPDLLHLWLSGICFGGSHDCLDESNDRLPYGRLGSRNACRARPANAFARRDFATRNAAGHDTQEARGGDRLAC